MMTTALNIFRFSKLMYHIAAHDLRTGMCDHQGTKTSNYKLEHHIDKDGTLQIGRPCTLGEKKWTHLYR